MYIDLPPVLMTTDEEILPEEVWRAVTGNDGKVYCPDGDDELEPYEHLKRGLCMCCGGSLGENTTLLLTGVGIIGLWCSGGCLQDLQAVGMLREMEEQIVDRIDRRGSAD